MKSTGIATGLGNSSAVQKKHFAVLGGGHRNGKMHHPRTGKGFGKGIGRVHVGKNASVAVIVHLHHLNGAGQHHADELGTGAFGKDRIFLIKKLHACAQTDEHAEQILVGNIAKKRAFS